MVREHSLSVPRTARYYTFGRERDPREIWICCHGYGQLASDFAGLLRPLDNGHRLVVVPEALSRFYVDDPTKEHGPGSPVGATWMTREARLEEIADYVRYLDLLSRAVRTSVEREPTAMCALGFSQGAATASRWATMGQERVSRLVLWGGVLPPDLDLETAGERLKALELIVVAGERDGYANATRLRELEERLGELAVAFQLVRFTGGHRLDRDVLGRLGRNPDDSRPATDGAGSPPAR